MLKRWGSLPPGIRWLVGIAVVVLALAFVWALFVPVADLLAHHDVGSARGQLLQTARDAARGRLLTLAAGLFAVGALVYTARNFTLSRRTFELTEQGQVTDRYTKAVEQLGSDKLDVRLGGIYALERVARDSVRDHPAVMEVLTAFIREHSRELWPLPEPRGAEPERSPRPNVQAAVTVVYPERPPRPDVQAAVTVVGRRDAECDIRSIDLRGADLRGADLREAKLIGAWLNRVNLSGANLTGADLRDAELFEADLHKADLTGADLGDAELACANLTDAILGGVKHGDHSGPHGEIWIGKDTVDADLSGADLAGAQLEGVRWPRGTAVPPGFERDNFSGRLKQTLAF